MGINTVAAWWPEICPGRKREKRGQMAFDCPQLKNSYRNMKTSQNKSCREKKHL